MQIPAHVRRRRTVRAVDGARSLSSHCDNAVQRGRAHLSPAFGSGPTSRFGIWLVSAAHRRCLPFGASRPSASDASWSIACYAQPRRSICLASRNCASKSAWLTFTRGSASTDHRLAKHLPSGGEFDRIAPRRRPHAAASCLAERRLASRNADPTRTGGDLALPPAAATRIDPFRRDRQLRQIERLRHVSAAEAVHQRPDWIINRNLNGTREVRGKRIIDHRAERRVGCERLVLRHRRAGESGLVHAIGCRLRKKMNARAQALAASARSGTMSSST